MQRKHASNTSAIALALAATPLAAGSAATGKIDITTWNQADLYDGWTAQQLFDTEVRGSETDEPARSRTLSSAPTARSPR